MNRYNTVGLDTAALNTLCRRTAIDFDDILPKVREILADVKRDGDAAVRRYEEMFGAGSPEITQVSEDEIAAASARMPQVTRDAFARAAANIEKFHRSQLVSENTMVETMPGVVCFAQLRAIDRAGLYIPGGTAPLPSTVLMLAIPAKLAGVSEITMCTPIGRDGSIADSVLFAADLCGVRRIFGIGGAQAIGAMAYGTAAVPKVDKICGPGNQYVTAAKMLVSIDPGGAAIDMPAGPSEVLVVADAQARADFVASDLLAQAEHGTDSQSVLVCTDAVKVEEILSEIDKQLWTLPRREIAEKALDNSFALLVASVDQAIAFANRYAPEHLILNIEDADAAIPAISNAGSVFIGAYSCESAGDYASGTNHSLPTYGYARAYSGVSVASFQRRITFQKITPAGATLLGPVVVEMATEEGLDAHRRAMEFRFKTPGNIQ